ncbi:hypothetical protein BS1321_21685 [Peribacillus simplex NBRC 15720 = DSM 1321]|uniref:Uncharacterized protein n=1 Tax=Peribacillus simplex NBRC 15720 = DSM 1321 TaxID=1349754 RepID=A0A223EMF6_9BACI|nr:hypothetical protein BS1321_21685 [Peribacillus simplex NBRC 15720 = DSM 1321]
MHSAFDHHCRELIYLVARNPGKQGIRFFDGNTDSIGKAYSPSSARNTTTFIDLLRKLPSISLSYYG